MFIYYFILITLFSVSAEAKLGFGTSFTSLGKPYGACGVPQSWLKLNGFELPFVALNTQFSSVSAPGQMEPVRDGMIGEFNNGKNCGRWIKMTVGKTCRNGSNNNDAVCIIDGTSGAKNYVSDVVSTRGDTVMGYVSDKCSDANVWCRTDRFHVDISEKAIKKYIDSGTWGNRMVDWEYVNKPHLKLKFGFSHGSYLPYYPALIIYNVSNGISKVSSKDSSGKMVPARMNGILGQMWVLSGVESSPVIVEVWDVFNKSYGKYSVDFPCGGTCVEPTKAISVKLGGDALPLTP